MFPTALVWLQGIQARSAKCRSSSSLFTLTVTRSKSSHHVGALLWSAPSSPAISWRASLPCLATISQRRYITTKHLYLLKEKYTEMANCVWARFVAAILLGATHLSLCLCFQATNWWDFVRAVCCQKSKTHRNSLFYLNKLIGFVKMGLQKYSVMILPLSSELEAAKHWPDRLQLFIY